MAILQAISLFYMIFLIPFALDLIKGLEDKLISYQCHRSTHLFGGAGPEHKTTPTPPWSSFLEIMSLVGVSTELGASWSL